MDTSESVSSSRRYNSRLGLILFAIYLVMYLGFVLINAFAADVMEMLTFAGLNLAIVYGFGLIVAAVVMALIYGVMCRNEPVDLNESGDSLESSSGEGESE